jgi:hypothetical protein
MDIVIGLLILVGATALMLGVIWLVITKLVKQQAGDARFKLFNGLMTVVGRRRR